MKWVMTWIICGIIVFANMMFINMFINEFENSQERKERYLESLEVHQVKVYEYFNTGKEWTFIIKVDGKPEEVHAKDIEMNFSRDYESPVLRFRHVEEDIKETSHRVNYTLRKGFYVEKLILPYDKKTVSDTVSLDEKEV